MDGLLILLGIAGVLAGIILLVVKVIAKSGLEYKWSILITAVSSVMFIAGVFQSSFRSSFKAGLKSAIDAVSDSPVSMKWNVQDLNVETNGNAAVAIHLLTSGQKNEVIEVKPATVFKAPWRYYGKILKMVGEVIIAQDYPPGSDISSSLGGVEVGELVMMTNDATIVDYMHLGSTGDINIGDNVIIYGYCIGHVEVENKLGGTTTQLMLIGDKVQPIE